MMSVTYPSTLLARERGDPHQYTYLRVVLRHGSTPHHMAQPDLDVVQRRYELGEDGKKVIGRKRRELDRALDLVLLGYTSGTNYTVRCDGLRIRCRKSRLRRKRRGRMLSETGDRLGRIRVMTIFPVSALQDGVRRWRLKRLQGI